MRRGLAVFRKSTFNRSAQGEKHFRPCEKKHPIALSAKIDLRGLIIVPGIPTADHPKETCNALAVLLQHVGIDKINVVCPQLHNYKKLAASGLT